MALMQQAARNAAARSTGAWFACVVRTKCTQAVVQFAHLVLSACVQTASSLQASWCTPVLKSVQEAVACSVSPCYLIVNFMFVQLNASQQHVNMMLTSQTLTAC